MDMAKFKAMFLSESEEHIRSMGSLLVEAEENPADSEGINALFRAAHSIKGMAASMGYEQMTGLAHHLEDSLDNYRQDGEISRSGIDRLLAGVDLLEELHEDISSDLPERDVSEFMKQKPDAEQAAEETVPETKEAGAHFLKLVLQENVISPSVRLLLVLKQLEALGTVENLSPERKQIMDGQDHRQLQLSLITKLNEQEIKQAFQDYPEIAEINFSTEPPSTEKRGEDRRQGERRGKAVTGGTVRVDTGLLDQFINLTGELITNRHMLQTAFGDQDWRELNDGLGQLGKLVKNLHGQVLKVRMMPVGSITERLPRVVRDLCRTNGKEITLKIEGAEIELDRTILEEVADPLVHMVRNSIDHGIEEKGTVQVKVWRERSHVQIQIQDDGRGIDPQKIRERALDKKLLSPKQAKSMSDSNVLQLICHPGFSTTDQVTETSGRGVGMDVVKAAVEKLGGTLLIDSKVGQGSCLTMKLPLSVAIIKILLFECEGKSLALPLSRILQTQQVDREEIITSGKQMMMELAGEKLPLISLRKVLGMSVPPAAKQISLVVMELFGRKVGLVVDRISGHQEVFVKKLPPPFDRMRGTNGGAVLGDGRVVFILDVQGFLERRR